MKDNKSAYNSSIYDEHITNVLPYYREYHNQALDVKMHIERRGVEVFPITIEQHIELLKKCGFRSVNVLWTSYLQAGFWAIK